jgi:predicted extracellular nuclease
VAISSGQIRDVRSPSEPDLLNCNSRFNDPGFFSEDVVASSDHDPFIVGRDTLPEFQVA